MVADRRLTDRRLPIVEGRRLIAPARRTVVGHPRIVPRLCLAVVIVEAEHLRTMVGAAGRLHRAAEVAIMVEAEGDVPLLAAATVAIAN